MQCQEISTEIQGDAQLQSVSIIKAVALFVFFVFVLGFFGLVNRQYATCPVCGFCDGGEFLVRADIVLLDFLMNFRLARRKFL